jgi:RimJ/RimL family protein N-acetyltransferase
MAGIKRIEKDSTVTIDYIVDRLLRPDIRKALFDDALGAGDISMLLNATTTKIYGIFSRGLPEPAGVVIFTGVWPYRDCTVYSAIFDKENRKKGMITEVYEQIKKDIIERHAIHSVTAQTVGNNIASMKTLEMMGFKKVGVKPKAIFSDGKYKDITIFYVLLDGQEE